MIFIVKHAKIIDIIYNVEIQKHDNKSIKEIFQM